MGEYGDLYAEGRARLIDLVAGADPAAPVPACPDWTVKDVLAHVTGVCADIIGGRLEGVTTPAWTQAQVDARRDLSVADIVAEWRTTGPEIDAIVDSFGPTGAQLLADVTTHEHDVRGALGSPGARDAAVIPVALGFITDRLAERVPRPLEIRAGDLTYALGDGDGAPPMTLTTTPFELLRATTGRRSRAQVAAMDWSSDPEPYLDLFAGGPFTFPPADLIE